MYIFTPAKRDNVASLEMGGMETGRRREKGR